MQLVPAREQPFEQTLGVNGAAGAGDSDDNSHDVKRLLPPRPRFPDYGEETRLAEPLRNRAVNPNPKTTDLSSPTTIRNRLRTALIVSLLVYLAVNPYFTHVFKETWAYVGMDFPIFYTAAQKVRQGESPYPPVVEVSSDDPSKRSWGGYIYPPLFALLLAPLTALGPEHAKQVFTVVSVALFFYLLWPTRGCWVEGLSFPRLAALFLIFLWGPAIDTLRFGQSNLVTLFLICGALAVIRHGTARLWNRSWIAYSAGALMGASAMVKLTSGIVVPIAMVLGAWRFCAGFFAGMVAVALATQPFWNWDYFTRVLPTLRDFPQYDVFFSIHQAVREILIVFTPFGLDPGWADREGAHAGLLVSGLFFALVLVIVFNRRRVLTETNAILLGCYLAPLLAGEKFHHYTLAILPVLYGTHQLFEHARIGPVPSPDGRGDSGVRFAAAPAAVRLALLPIALLPNFYFNWLGNWIHFHFRESTGLTSNLLIAVGNLAAFLLILPELMAPIEEQKKPREVDTP